MTECERLLKEGFISEEFLKEEIRDDYKINKEMKKVWAVQLSILNDFINVCSDHNLTYWVIGGSLLGTIRHKGYIPWDDDIDVSMPRKDYDILIKHPEWFRHPNLLHLPSNKEKYYEGWARVHNVNTSVLYKNYKKEGSKQGIYLDIFPLDDFSDSKKEIKAIKKIWRTNLFGHAFCYNANSNFSAKAISFLLRTFHAFNSEKTFNKINKLAKMSPTDAEYLASKMVHSYRIERQFFNKEDFNDSTEADFEFLKVKIPVGYDRILQKNYPNYMEFPPVQSRGCWHDFIFDVEHPYDFYNKFV